MHYQKNRLCNMWAYIGIRANLNEASEYMSLILSWGFEANVSKPQESLIAMFYCHPYCAYWEKE